MQAILTGAGLALLVSLPPGANTLLCLLRARQSIRAALQVAVAAATADTVYALLTGLGVLGLVLSGASSILQIAAIPFLLLCAWLLWPRGHQLRTGAIWAAAFNPPAALLWLSLTSATVVQHSVLDVLGFTLGAGLTTLSWFSLLTLAANHGAQLLSDVFVYRAAQAFSLLLVILALVQAVRLLA